MGFSTGSQLFTKEHESLSGRCRSVAFVCLIVHTSNKCLLDVFKKLELVRSTGNEVTVLWHNEPDEEDMLEADEDYQAIINIPFKMIQIEEVGGRRAEEKQARPPFVEGGPAAELCTLLCFRCCVSLRGIAGRTCTGGTTGSNPEPDGFARFKTLHGETRA